MAGTAPNNVLAQCLKSAQAAGKKRKLGLALEFRCNFMLVQALAETGNLCMVPPHLGLFIGNRHIQPETFVMGPRPLERGLSRSQAAGLKGRASTCRHHRAVAATTFYTRTAKSGHASVFHPY